MFTTSFFMNSCRGDTFRFLWWLLKSKHKRVPVFDKVKHQTPEMRSDSTEDVGTHNFVCCNFFQDEGDDQLFQTENGF